MHIVVALAAAGAGYAIGRTRPYGRMADWTEDQIRFHPDHWGTPARSALLFAAFLLTDPKSAVRAWRISRSEES